MSIVKDAEHFYNKSQTGRGEMIEKKGKETDFPSVPL